MFYTSNNRYKTARMMIFTADVLFLFFATAPSLFAGAYFVSPDGNNANNGTSVKNAWKTISFAVSAKSPVKPGDKVYVKAGIYHEHLVFAKSGIKNKPVILEGYKNEPGDNPKVTFRLGMKLNSSLMPLLDGKNRKSGTAIKIDSGSYIVMKNFQITNYRAGVVIWGESNNNITVDNLILSKFGKLDGSYSGKGIVSTYASNIFIRNCVVANAQAEAISLIGNKSVIENCKVYSNELLPERGAEGTDYYIHVSGNDNIIRDCYIERTVPAGLGNFPHVGHGIGFKETAENNLVENCTAVNLAGGGFYVRWSGVKNNKFVNCKAYGPVKGKENDSCGFLVREGACNNTFEKCTTDGCDVAVRFLNGGEEPGEYTAYKNTLKNCVFKNSGTAVDLSAYSEEDTAPVVDNIFEKCTFDKAGFLFNIRRENEGNKMVECRIKNVKNFMTPGSDKTIKFKFEKTRVPKR